MKNDCFAYVGKPNMLCEALNVSFCNKDNCSFYKSEEKKKADDLKAAKRLMIIRGEINENRG